MERDTVETIAIHDGVVVHLAALLVVDRTLIRSPWTSAQCLIAITVGMTIAWLIGSSTGLHWGSVAPVIIFAVLIGRSPRFGTHGIQVPTMIILPLVTVGGTSGSFALITIVETLAGGIIGVAVNAIVVAPLHVDEAHDTASALTRQVHELLTVISEGLRTGGGEDTAIGWNRSGDEIIHLAPDVSAHITVGHESNRLNPRDRLRKVQINWEGCRHSVEALRRAPWHRSGIARTLLDAANVRVRRQPLDPAFWRSTPMPLTTSVRP